MCVIYFDRQDYRAAMRSPWDASRAHAICRKLLGVSASWKDRHRLGCSKLSLWYGAHYYAACALTDYSVLHEEDAVKRQPILDERIAFWGKCFAREADGCGGDADPPMCAGVAALWRLALRRVHSVLSDALVLESSVLW